MYFFSNSPVKCRLTKVVFYYVQGMVSSQLGMNMVCQERQTFPVPPSPQRTSLKVGTFCCGRREEGCHRSERGDTQHVQQSFRVTLSFALKRKGDSTGLASSPRPFLFSSRSWLSSQFVKDSLEPKYETIKLRGYNCGPHANEVKEFGRLD
jgi:hypothetical protein